MSFNSFFSMFGNNNSNGSLEINQATENLKTIPAEEFVLPDKSENTFESSEETLEIEETINFEGSSHISRNETAEIVQTIQAEPSTSFDKSIYIDESDSDELLELDDLFDLD